MSFHSVFFLLIFQWYIIQLERMVEDFTPYQLAHHLEAYVLWLFGWVMFTSSRGDIVDAHWIPYTQAIADSDLDRFLSFHGGQRSFAGPIEGCARHA
jgi:hypothetical protein